MGRPRHGRGVRDSRGVERPNLGRCLPWKSRQPLRAPCVSMAQRLAFLLHRHRLASAFFVDSDFTTPRCLHCSDMPAMDPDVLRLRRVLPRPISDLERARARSRRLRAPPDPCSIENQLRAGRSPVRAERVGLHCGKARAVRVHGHKRFGCVVRCVALEGDLVSLRGVDGREIGRGAGER